MLRNFSASRQLLHPADITREKEIHEIAEERITSRSQVPIPIIGPKITYRAGAGGGGRKEKTQNDKITITQYKDLYMYLEKRTIILR